MCALPSRVKVTIVGLTCLEPDDCLRTSFVGFWPLTSRDRTAGMATRLVAQLYPLAWRHVIASPAHFAALVPAQPFGRHLSLRILTRRCVHRVLAVATGEPEQSLDRFHDPPFPVPASVRLLGRECTLVQPARVCLDSDDLLLRRSLARFLLTCVPTVQTRFRHVCERP